MVHKFSTSLLAGLALFASVDASDAQSRVGWSPKMSTPYTRMAETNAVKRAEAAPAVMEPVPKARPVPKTVSKPQAKLTPKPPSANRTTSQPQRTAAKPGQQIVRQAYAEEIPVETQFENTAPGFSPNGSECCDEYWGNDCCQPSTRFWGRAEYLLWWTKGMEVPALATTSPNGTVIEDAGVLGIPGTSVVFGDGPLNNDATSGGRFFLGGWLDECQSEGIEFNYMTLGKQTDRFSGSSDQFNILARPFYNVDDFSQASRLISFPDLISGDMNVVATTSFQSAEVLFRYVARQSCRCRTDLFVGYRYGDLRDHLRINEFTTDEDDLTTFDLYDEFNTRNTFNGVDFGVTQQWATNSCWVIEASARVAIGVNTNRVGINGQTIITPDGDPSETFVGGLLAQSSNIGSYSQSDFGSIGEFGLTGRRQITKGLTAIMGYRFLYWADVARAGKQIDTRINPTQLSGGDLVGPALPAFTFKTETFWAQGFHFGLEYTF